MRTLLLFLISLTTFSSETNENSLIIAIKCEIANQPPEVVIIIDKQRELWTFFGADDSLDWNEKINTPPIFYPPKELIITPYLYSYVLGEKPMIRIGPISTEDEIDYDWIERDTLIRRGWSGESDEGDKCEIHPVPEKYNEFIEEYDYTNE